VNDDIVVTMINVLLLVSWSCANTISVMCTDGWITIFMIVSVIRTMSLQYIIIIMTRITDLVSIGVTCNNQELTLMNNSTTNNFR